MKILTVSDIESKSLYDYYDKSKLEGVELILSCGDLNPDYLEFLVTMGKAPVLYVRGNHDDKYLAHPPQGCICIDDRVYNYRGLRIAGLGGCLRYKKEGTFLYEERQQRKRVQKLRRQIGLYNGIDIFLSHAPAKGLGDGKDFAHQGFDCYYELLDTYKPKYFVHGHVHLNYGEGVREQDYGATRVINAFDNYTIEMDSSEYPAGNTGTGSLIYDLYHRLRYKDEA